MLALFLIDPLVDSHTEALFTQVGAIANICIAAGTLLTALLIPFTILLNGKQLTKEEKAGSERKRFQFYGTIDAIYYDIQKQIIAVPHLANADPTGKSPEQLAQYDAFAFMTWNFIESIIDYSQDDPFLKKTWGCIVDYEVAKHAQWFLNPSNRVKFKSEFIAEILEKKLFIGSAATANPVDRK